MLLGSLLFIPLSGIFAISLVDYLYNKKQSSIFMSKIALGTSLLNLIVSFVYFILFNFSINNYQFVEEHYNI